jgi:hypothetical protein
MTKMNFMTLTGAMALAATLAISATAQAATILTWNNSNVGVTNSVDFNGADDGDLVTGLTANIDYKLTSIGNSGKSWVFSYNVENTSDAPVSYADITGFGFNVDPNISSASATGEFTRDYSGYVSGLGSREVCITSAYSCSGSSWSGVSINDHGVGSFTLNFSSAKTSVTLSDLYVAYQSVYGGREWNDEAVGTPVVSVAAVPEPATWAMMLVGFFAIGSTLRSARRQGVAA